MKLMGFSTPNCRNTLNLQCFNACMHEQIERIVLFVQKARYVKIYDNGKESNLLLLLLNDLLQHL